MSRSLRKDHKALGPHSPQSHESIESVLTMKVPQEPSAATAEPLAPSQASWPLCPSAAPSSAGWASLIVPNRGRGGDLTALPYAFLCAQQPQASGFGREMLL